MTMWCCIYGRKQRQDNLALLQHIPQYKWLLSLALFSNCMIIIIIIPFTQLICGMCNTYPFSLGSRHSQGYFMSTESEWEKSAINSFHIFCFSFSFDNAHSILFTTLQQLNRIHTKSGLAVDRAIHCNTVLLWVFVLKTLSACVIFVLLIWCVHFKYIEFEWHSYCTTFVIRVWVNKQRKKQINIGLNFASAP